MKVSVLQVKTRGLRNNNPGNIRRSFTKWIGLCPEQIDNEFCQFEHIKFGIRAFLVLCRTYHKKYGIMTIPQFLSRYAPLSENDTFFYIKFCLKYCGFEVFHDDSDFAMFVCSVFWYESKFTCTPQYILSLMSEFKIKIM